MADVFVDALAGRSVERILLVDGNDDAPGEVRVGDGFTDERTCGVDDRVGTSRSVHTVLLASEFLEELVLDGFVVESERFSKLRDGFTHGDGAYVFVLLRETLERAAREDGADGVGDVVVHDVDHDRLEFEGEGFVFHEVVEQFGRDPVRAGRDLFRELAAEVLLDGSLVGVSRFPEGRHRILSVGNSARRMEALQLVDLVVDVRLRAAGEIYLFENFDSFLELVQVDVFVGFLRLFEVIADGLIFGAEVATAGRSSAREVLDDMSLGAEVAVDELIAHEVLLLAFGGVTLKLAKEVSRESKEAQDVVLFAVQVFTMFRAQCGVAGDLATSEVGCCDAEMALGSTAAERLTAAEEFNNSLPVQGVAEVLTLRSPRGDVRTFWESRFGRRRR